MADRLIISAISISTPGTMGGNSKITIEMARCLAGDCEVHVLLPASRITTFTDNLPPNHGIHFHLLADFAGNDKYNPLFSSVWYTQEARKALREIQANSADWLFGCSDFHVDVLTMYKLQGEFGFRWLPSVFLFVPFIFENLSMGYGFPAAKYVVYWVYQRLLFFLMKHRATAFVVTNSSDFCRFPKRFQGKIFDYYGGVNVEQLPRVSVPKTRDVVFCSRLHPQKGIDAFLDVWKLVHDKLPSVRFSVIGNGEPDYEAYLKDKANRLGIADSIDWLGYVNNEAKFRIYSEARLFVHPTVFDNNGMVAAEALCTGLPVVMQDIPALRHVYTTGCAKVPYGDRDAFAARIIELLSNPDRLAALAPTADQLAALRKHWCWESRASEFSKWLETISDRTKEPSNHAGR